MYNNYSATNSDHLIANFPDVFHGGFLGGGGGWQIVPPTTPVTQIAQTTNKLESVGNVRNVFPETWLWSNASVGYDTAIVGFEVFKFAHGYRIASVLSLYMSCICKKADLWFNQMDVG